MRLGGLAWGCLMGYKLERGEGGEERRGMGEREERGCGMCIGNKKKRPCAIGVL